MEPQQPPSSLAGEARLALYFQDLAQGERHIEVARELLSKQCLFEPRAVFSHLAGPGKSRVHTLDFLRFAKTNRLALTEEQAFDIVRHYSSGKRGELSYSDFLNFVLPAQNLALRKVAINRRGILKLNVEKKLPMEVELALCKLIRAELRLQDRMRGFRVELASRAGYKIYQLFKLVSPVEKAEDIKAENIAKFLAKHRVYALNSDLISILQRLDRDRDGKVSYMDFVDSLLPYEPASFAKRRPQKETTISTYKNRHASSLSGIDSPEKRLSSIKSEDISRLRPSSGLEEKEPEDYSKQETPEEIVTSRHVGVELGEEEKEKQPQVPPAGGLLSVSGYKTPERKLAADRSPEYPTTGETPGKLAVVPREEKTGTAKDLSKIFKEQIKLDKEAETARESVCLKTDYNVRDVFSYFDLKKKGSIALYELRIGLERLEISRNSSELLPLMKRYDLDKNGSLSYPEFEAMLLPRKKYYVDLVGKRGPKASAGEMIFSEETKLLLMALIHTLIDTELAMEKLRRKASTLLFENAFKMCGPDDSVGLISSDDLTKMLDKNMCFVSDHDVEILMNRYDKDRDARISFSEFVQELTPSPAAI